MRSSDAFKSAYLKSEDLKGRKIVVTVDKVMMETIGQGARAQEKPVMYFVGKDRAMVLNATNWHRLKEWLGSDESDDWTGRQCVLGTEPTTDPNGKPTMGLRIVGVPEDAPKPAREPAPEPYLAEAPDDDVPFGLLLPFLLGAFFV